MKQKKFRLNLSIKIILGCSLTLIIALGISFYFLTKKQERIIMEQAEKEARAIFKQIVIARKWIADHGGVFVERRHGVNPNPYLKGMKAEISDIEGKRYVKRNPAMVTKELSRYSEKEGLYWFHITSLKLTNPENAPDDFEKKALLEFEKKNLTELFSIEKIKSSTYLRYISPLYVEASCLSCHAKQGYKIGDVRGAISITIPLDKTISYISTNRKAMFISAIITLLSLITALFLMIRKIVLTPMKRLQNAINDFSEGKYHPEKRLKTGDEFEELCNAFSAMAAVLSEYHSCLNSKIREATKGLEDINQRLIEANRLLNDANMKKSDFIAKLSHELRTPLTSIKGAMDYISVKLAQFINNGSDVKKIDDLYTFFDVIKNNSDRLIRMVNSMLDIERIETGVFDMHFREVNLSNLISEVLIYFQLEAEKKGLIFNAHIPDKLVVYADEDRIKQVLINILSNAIKFSPPESEITIFAYKEKNYTIVEIWDEGPGVLPSEQERIFEKFYKNGNQQGTGLGLAICKGIIDLHKGIIGVKSDGKNGSCFFFKLPILEKIENPSESEEKPNLLDITEKIATPC
jgi:signal transduction histidine kinase